MTVRMATPNSTNTDARKRRRLIRNRRHPPRARKIGVLPAPWDVKMFWRELSKVRPISL